MMPGKTTNIALSAMTALTFCIAAQSQEGEQPNIVSIEIFGCSFLDNNDLGDLMAVTDRWNEWADQNGVTDYTANVLTPYLYSQAFPYDVVWLGVYPSEQSMGAGQAQWLADGQDMNAEFGEVVSCSVHGLFAGVATHIPEGPPPGQDDGMVNLTAFQDCTLVNESNAQEALAAHGGWGDYLAENGSDVFMGALFPVAGEDPSAGYDYKAIADFPSAEAWGEYLGTIIPNGLQTANQTFGRVTQCDTARVYTSVQVRASDQG